MSDGDPRLPLWTSQPAVPGPQGPPGPPGPPGAGAFQTDLTIASAGQTSFPLSMIPSNPANMRMSVNGQIATQGLDYTIAFAVVTWLNTDYVMSAGDEVLFYYEV